MAERNLHAIDPSTEPEAPVEHPKGWKPIGKRVHPREIFPDDPLFREYTWSQLPAFECRFPTKFKAAASSGSPPRTWTLACCKTYFSKATLAEHMAEEHHIDPPSELEGD
jgi:hypothetical protein